MKKRIISYILVVVMVLTLLPATAFADECDHIYQCELCGGYDCTLGLVPHHYSNGLCSACWEICPECGWDSLAIGYENSCTTCGLEGQCTHHFVNGKCDVCGDSCIYCYGLSCELGIGNTCPTCGLTGTDHNFLDGGCTICEYATCSECDGNSHNIGSGRTCSTCGLVGGDHVWKDGSCDGCGAQCECIYNYCDSDYASLGTCPICGNTAWKKHAWNSSTGTCSRCETYCPECYGTPCNVGAGRNCEVCGLVGCDHDFDENSICRIHYGLCTVCNGNDCHIEAGRKCPQCGRVGTGHSWADGECQICHTVCAVCNGNKCALGVGNTCSNCGLVGTNHDWNDGECRNCRSTCPECRGKSCELGTGNTCSTCGLVGGHIWENGSCSVCWDTCPECKGSCCELGAGNTCSTCGLSGTDHAWTHDEWGNGYCENCSALCPTCGGDLWNPHRCMDCPTCGLEKTGDDDHHFVHGVCTLCDYHCPHVLKCIYCTKELVPDTAWTMLGKAMSGISIGSNDYFTVSDVSGVRTITLIADITAGTDDIELTVPGDKEIVLDLNGHVLDRGLTSRATLTDDDLEHGAVIVMIEDGNLTITDSNPTAVHKFTELTSGEYKGLWMLDETDGEKEVAGGVITGGTGYFTGGILAGRGAGDHVWVIQTDDTTGSVTMTGGNIIGNIGCGEQGGGVRIYEGSFTMSDDSLICGNYSAMGGGVFAADNTTFIMDGGVISENVASEYGGGVFITCGAQFTMKNGSIKNNVCVNTDDDFGLGGGVYMSSDGDQTQFTMEDGEISGNEANNGGGVYVGYEQYFHMKDGSITDNIASAYDGGGVYDFGTFIMDDGEISANEARRGGGVYVVDPGVFTVSSASITGNTANEWGGGICNDIGTVNLTAPAGKQITITGNTAERTGGGIWKNHAMSMSGKIIVKDNICPCGFKNLVRGFDDGELISITGALTGSDIYASIASTEWNDDTEEWDGDFWGGLLTDGYTDSNPGAELTSFFHYEGDTAKCKMILNDDGELEIVEKLVIRNDQPLEDKDTNNGYIEVPEKAFPGDTVTVTVVPNSGYQLKGLWYYDNNYEGYWREITDTKTFIMLNQDWRNEVSAEFEEVTVSSITVLAIASPAKIASGGSVTISGTVMDGDTPVTSGNVYVQVGAIQTPLILNLNSDGSYSKTLQELQGTEPIVFTVTYSYDGENYRASCTVEFEEIAPVFAVTFDMNGHGTTPAAISVTSGAAISSDQLPAPTESGYTFGGWFREAVCENAWNDTDIVTGDMTLYAKWTEAPVPSPRLARNKESQVTVPVSGDENSVSVKATVSGKTATIKPISEEEIRKVIGDDVETGMVAIDLSSTNKTITGVKLPTETVQAIAEAAAEIGNDTAGLKLMLSSGILEFDAKALETIAAAAGDADNIEIHFDEVGTTRLNNVQKEAVSEMDVLEGFEAYVTVNGKRVSDFEGGSVTVYIPYEVPEDKDPAAYTVWYVAEDATLEKMDTTYDGENHRFVVSHFSDYVLTYDETAGQYNNCPKDETCPMSKFTDVDMKAWYHDGVHYCLDNSIMTGFPGDLFKPNGTTTRAQIAQILYNLEGQPAFMNDNVFTDVVSGSWYEKAVVWAQGKGVVAGYPDGTFKPNDPITREQLAVILYNYAKYKEIDVTVDENTNSLSFNDFWDTSEWAKPAMMWAIDRELIVGTNWDLKPQGDAVRAQAATIMCKFCETVVK